MDKRFLLDEARRILADNDRGGYTVPTRGMYPYQWNRDSAFVALGFATFDMDRAIREIESLFEGQWSNGMVPHIVFRVSEPTYFPGPAVWRTNKSPESSGITQPPVAASVAWRLWSATSDTALRMRLQALFPKLLASHRWFHEFRDTDKRGGVIMTHPWESGRDNSPEWDAPMANVDVSGVEPYQRRDLDHANADMRPTKAQYDCFVALLQFGRDCGWDARHIGRCNPLRVADVGMTMILLRANRDLKAMAEAIGASDAAAEIDCWIRLGDAGAESLWNEDTGSYCSRDAITGLSSGYVTSASFLAFYAGVGSEAQRRRLLAHFGRIAGKVRYMTPSFDPDEPAFESSRYWRGPVWAVVNFMIAQGLAEAGNDAEAARVRKDSLALIVQSGFREAFDPMSGAGAGGYSFSWTAAMFLAWSGASV